MPAPVPTPATPSAVNAPVDGDNNPIYIEQPDSGDWVINRTFRTTLRYKVFPYDAIYSTVNSLPFYVFYRGDLVVIDEAVYIVSESRVRKLKPQTALIEVDCESINQTPSDEVSLDPVEQQPRVERAPIFRPLNTQDFAVVQMAFLALSSGQIQNATNQFVNTSDQALAQKLYDKLRQGMESFYLSQWRYTWSTYFESIVENDEVILQPPSVSLGGVTQEPGGPFGFLLGGVQWLREADHLSVSGQSPLGTILKLTRSWIGGPNTFWDPDIYPPG